MGLFVFTYGSRVSDESPSELMSLLTMDSQSLMRGELWRLFSAPFIYSNILQLFICLVAIYFMGGYVSRRLGTTWFLIAYIGCGAVGGLLPALISGGGRFEAGPAAVFGITLLCILYFPYMYFFGGITAKRFGPLLMAAALLASLSFGARDLAFLGELASLPAAMAIYKLEPMVERYRTRRRLRREIIGAFTEAEREEHLDRLLKKVANEGMDSLNKRERNFLQAVSKQYRRKKVNNH